MKRLLLFLQQVLLDLEDWCGVSASNDFKTIVAREKTEGLSFLTITLTNFGKDLETGLDQGFVDRHLFTGFQRKGELPRLFGGFLDLVFDRKTGRLLDSPNTEAIKALRQLTLMFGKIALPCTPERDYKARAGYVQVEKELRQHDKQLNPVLMTRFKRLSLMLFGDVLATVDREIALGEIVPKHGPGATADALFGNSKYMQKEWTERLEKVFSMTDFLLPSPSYYHSLDNVVVLEPGQERPVKVISVPKTLKTPRIIAIEPTAMQYVQQGLLRSFESALRNFPVPHRIISWQSTEPNHALALEGSRKGTFATLDLSEASDRVSNQHVRNLLRGFPHLFEGVDACRSRKADVLDFGVIRLSKFASMGSALTFPMEAMVFATIVFMAIESELSRPLRKKDIEYFSREVRVYGDDIIVPVDFASSVVRALEDFGLRVNRSKSFWTGKFRETCGKEFYDGVDVSITRVRREFPTDRLQAAEIISTIELRNHLYLDGMWRSVRFLDKLIEDLRIPFPIVEETSPIVGRTSFLPYRAEKMCPKLHRPLVKGLVVKADPRESYLDDQYALLKVLSLKKIEESATPDSLDLLLTRPPTLDDRHLQFAGRPRAVSTTARWTTPY